MYDDNEQKTKDGSSDFLDELYNLDDDYLGCCASSHDCTGLIPTGMASEADLISYKDVYSFPPAVMVKEKEKYIFAKEQDSVTDLKVESTMDKLS